MNRFITSPNSLADVVKQIMQALLRKESNNDKNYLKLDINIHDEKEFFTVQITKCSRDPTDLILLLEDTFKNLANTQQWAKNDVLATVQEKLVKVIRKHQVIYTENAVVFANATQTAQEQTEFSSFLRYVSTKLMLKVRNIYLKDFTPLLLNEIKQMEKIYKNVKFLFRRNKHHIYRNHVPMDDSVLSCKILAFSCTRVFQNSINDQFRKHLERLFVSKTSDIIESKIGCLLLSQVNNNFVAPVAYLNK